MGNLWKQYKHYEAKVPGSPSNLEDAAQLGKWNPMSMFHGGENSYDIAALGSQLSKSPRARDSGRAIGAAIAAYFSMGSSLGVEGGVGAGEIGAGIGAGEVGAGIGAGEVGAGAGVGAGTGAAGTGGASGAGIDLSAPVAEGGLEGSPAGSGPASNSSTPFWQKMMQQQAMGGGQQRKHVNLDMPDALTDSMEERRRAQPIVDQMFRARFNSSNPYADRG